MTAQTVENVTTSTDQVLIVEKGTELARILANVLPSASKDETLPILEAVHVDVTADRITVAATDRYTLSTDYIERSKDESEWPSMSFNLHRDDVTKLVKLVKAEKITIVPVTLTLGDHGRVSASTWSGGITSQLVEGEFPSYQKLFPTDASVGGWEYTNLNLAYLARFSKVLGEQASKAYGIAKLSFYGDDTNRKPVVVTIPSYSDTFRALIMPVRIDS